MMHLFACKGLNKQMFHFPPLINIMKKMQWVT